ncbi:hypothetical protein O6H91_05G102300 [Diphasiastrum complanatum]|uniref:Uncharacterized protein n=1 Tax=Diphasiastrum complanatum TaxID=34168 RepID=A0ACC2DRG9_DIPCM|nr:hypothetical protein O6H91_05G102300 [Diphasiastrum complanatum]
MDYKIDDNNTTLRSCALKGYTDICSCQSLISPQGLQIQNELELKPCSKTVNLLKDGRRVGPWLIFFLVLRTVLIHPLVLYNNFEFRRSNTERPTTVGQKTLTQAAGIEMIQYIFFEIRC